MESKWELRIVPKDKRVSSFCVPAEIVCSFNGIVYHPTQRLPGNVMFVMLRLGDVAAIQRVIKP